MVRTRSLRANRIRDKPESPDPVTRNFVRQFSPKQSKGTAEHTKMGGGKSHEVYESKNLPC